MLFAGPGEAETKDLVVNVIRGVGFSPFHVGPIRYARNLEAMAELWVHMAVAPLGDAVDVRWVAGGRLQP